MDDKRLDKRIRELLNRHHEAVPGRLWEKVAAGTENRRRGAAWWKYAVVAVLLISGLGYVGYRFTGEPNAVLQRPQQDKKAMKTHGVKSEQGISSHTATPAAKVDAGPMHGTTLAGTSRGPQSTAPDNATTNGFPLALTAYVTDPEISGEEPGESTEEGPARAIESETAYQTGENLPASDDHATPEAEPQQTSEQPQEAEAAAAAEEQATEQDQQSEQSTPDLKTKTVESPSGLSGFSIEILASPEFPIKSLSAREGFAYANYVKVRKESELYDHAYSLSLFVRNDLSKSFFIRAGIQYERIYEQLSLQAADLLLAQVSIDTLLKSFLLSPFQPPKAYFVLDTLFNYDYSRFPREVRNRYIFIHLPVSAGFRTSLKKIDLYTTAGFSLNIATYSRGAIVAPDSEYMLILEDAGSTPFKMQSGLSAHISAGMAYKIGARLALLVESAFKLGISSMTTSDYPLKQRYSAVSLGAGLKMDF